MPDRASRTRRTPPRVVVTAGPILRNPHATIQAGWLGEGAFASLVDFDSYWHPAAMKEVDKFCTDDTPQLRHYQQVGYFQEIPPVHADLGELVVGGKPGRESQVVGISSRMERWLPLSSPLVIP